jgi:hypothetical protein
MPALLGGAASVAVDVDDKGGAHVHGAVDDNVDVNVGVGVDDDVGRGRSGRRRRGAR